MDCEGILFSEPIPSFLDNDAVIDEMYRDLASWEGAILMTDANFIELTPSEPAIEGPSVTAGDLQFDNDQGLELMAPLKCELSLDEINHMNLLVIGDEFWESRVSEVHIHEGNQNGLESCLDYLLYRDPPERNGFQSLIPVDPVATYFGESVPFLDPLELDQYQTFTDPVNTYSANSAPRLYIEDAYESTPNEARSRTSQSLQSFPDPMESHLISASHDVERIYTEGDQHEHQDYSNILACIVCGNYSEFQIVGTCGHAGCQQYCRETWLQGEGEACPNCWYTPGEDVNVSAVCNGPAVNLGSNLEYRTDHEQEYQSGLAPPRDLDIIVCSLQHETEELNPAVQERTLEYQLVFQDGEGEYFIETLNNEAAAELGPSVMLIELPEEILSTSKQSEQQQGSQICRKRGRETLVVDHNGVAMRYDGSEERFTAYYRPSYWTEDDSSVFLGEYASHEEATDAHNLVAILHEGEVAQIIMPYTADKYTDELKRWEGKHHVDLVCELRLRGRGFLKDGAVNYKHVGRRWSGKKKGTRYFSTVSDGPVSSSNAKAGKPKRTFLTTFDTPEQAAQYADQVLVKRKGPEAWTNFPLSHYITCKDELPLSFLPISNNFRDNLTYKRTKPDVAFS